ncbi:MAG: D-aminoacylase, partial [Chloroflexota bacterium]
MTDVLIRGGTVIDGTGAPAMRADVAVTNGRITDVGEFTGRRAMKMIDARDRVVAPGFIDIHSHSDESVLVNNALESTLHQGVTLVVCGNCGGSSAPVHGLAAEEADRELARMDLERTWSSFYEYVAAVEEKGSSINFSSFVGHGTLRMCVMGAESRPPSAHELDQMRRLLARALDEG